MRSDELSLGKEVAVHFRGAWAKARVIEVKTDASVVQILWNGHQHKRILYNRSIFPNEGKYREWTAQTARRNAEGVKRHA